VVVVVETITNQHLVVRVVQVVEDLEHKEQAVETAQQTLVAVVAVAVVDNYRLMDEVQAVLSLFVTHAVK
jgi:hypothetical protein